MDLNSKAACIKIYNLYADGQREFEGCVTELVALGEDELDARERLMIATGWSDVTEHSDPSPLP